MYQASDFSYVKDSVFTHNEADLDGGGFYLTYPRVSFLNTEFSYNRARRNGGAGFNIAGELILLDSNILSNQADQDGGGIYNNRYMLISRSAFLDDDAQGNGGGVYHATGSVYSIIESSTFHGNDAVRAEGFSLRRAYRSGIVHFTRTPPMQAAGARYMVRTPLI